MAKKKGRGNGEGTVYQRKDGRWIAQVTTDINPTTGKPKRRTFTGKTRSEVVKRMNEALADLEKGTYIEPTTITLERWLTDWLEGRKPHIATNTWSAYETMIRIHIIPTIGKIKLKDLKTRDIQKLLNDKLVNGKINRKGTNSKDTQQSNNNNQKGLSPRSIKYIYSTLNASLRQAVKERVIPFNPAEHCELPRLERKEMSVLKMEELAVFLKTAQQISPYYVAFYLDISTGMRRGELLGLTWDKINFQERTIEIKQQVINGLDNTPIITGLKTSKSRRTVKIDIDTASILKFHQKKQENHKKMIGLYHEKDNPTGLYHNNNLVFCTDDGRPINPRTFTKHFSWVLKKAGLSGTRLHDLRHLHATIALENGADLKTVSSNLGHSTIKTTGDTYAHVTEKMKDSVAEKVGLALAVCLKE